MQDIKFLRNNARFCPAYFFISMIFFESLLAITITPNYINPQISTNNNNFENTFQYLKVPSKYKSVYEYKIKII